MRRIAYAATLMVVATVGTAHGQEVRSESGAADVAEARAGVAEVRAVTVRALAEDIAERAAQQQQLFAAQAGLQRAASTLSNAASAYPVSYSISGRLADDAPSASPLPIGIVAAIRADTHLKSMSVGSGPANTLRVVDGAATVSMDNRPTFNAAFGFADLDEFHAWYSEQGSALHQAIERAGAEDVRFNLSVQPESSRLTF